MAFVVSGGSVRGLGMTYSQPFPSGSQTIRFSDDYAVAYHEIWKSHSSVRTAVTFLARNIAQLGLHTFTRASDTERKRMTTGPCAELIEKPNPWTTRYRLVDAMIHDLAIYNKAFFLKAKSPEGYSLIRLHPVQVQVETDHYDRPVKFRVTYIGQTAKTIVYDADAIFYLRGYAPDSSPLESLRRTLSEEWAAGLQREQLLRNGARVGGYLERPKDAPKWNEGTRERFVAQWAAQYGGLTAEKPGGTPVLEDGMTFKTAGQTAEELQYIEARKLTREEVASAYFIPPPMVGILDHATFSNVKEQHKHLYQDTLGPWLVMISEEWALQIIPDLAVPAKTYVEFNLEEKLRGSFEEQATQKSKAVGGPWMTRNEARALDNLPPIDGGDELITPKNVTEGGASDPTDTAPDEPNNEESNNDAA